jgi:hypothetical protein
LFATGVVYTGGKFAIGINNTSETGGKILCSFGFFFKVRYRRLKKTNGAALLEAE